MIDPIVLTDLWAIGTVQAIAALRDVHPPIFDYPELKRRDRALLESPAHENARFWLANRLEHMRPAYLTTVVDTGEFTPTDLADGEFAPWDQDWSRG